MIDKLKSRKFWITVGSLCAVVFAEQLGLDSAKLLDFVVVASSYLFGQSWVDGKKEQAQHELSSLRQRLESIRAKLEEQSSE